MNAIEFIAEIKDEAIEDMMTSGVLASITIAQGVEESAHGNHAPGHNLFGIKSRTNSGQLLWTHEYVNGKYIQIQDWFMKYDDWSGSITDHSAFLLGNSRYARHGFFTASDALDYKGAAQALQNAGYATNPSYAKNLIGIIETYRLYKFDQEAVFNLKKIEELEKRVEDLETKAKALDKTPAPDWFRTEFGEHCLDGVVNDLTGDTDFWRNVAVNLRLKK